MKWKFFITLIISMVILASFSVAPVLMWPGDDRIMWLFFIPFMGLMAGIAFFLHDVWEKDSKDVKQ